MMTGIYTYNAKIKSTSLGIEDHGIFTCYLYLEWDGGGVGFGGYGLDEWVGERGLNGKRIDITGPGTEYIKKILDTVGVESWEKLSGQYVRVKTGGIGSTAYAIGNLLKDKWFEPKVWFKEEYAING